MHAITLITMLIVVDSSLLQQQIYNTRLLISLYKSKLNHLQAISQLNINQNTSTTKQTPITLLTTFNASATIVPPSFILSSNHIWNLDGTSIASFKGQPIIIDPYKLTSIINNKVNVLQFKYQPTQYTLELKANKTLQSLWHYSKQFQNILVQSKQSTIYFIQSKNTQQINLRYQVICLASINQYKLFYLTKQSYGIINMRSFQIITNYTLESSALSCSIQQSSIFILLSNYSIILSTYQSNHRLYNLSLVHNPPYLHYSNPQITYIHPFMFIYSQSTNHFSICNLTMSNNLSYWKQMSVLGSSGQRYKYQFYRMNESIRLLQRVIRDMNGSIQQKTYNFDLNLNLELHSVHYWWKIILFITIITIIIYFKRTNQYQITQQPSNPKNKIQDIQQLLNRNHHKFKRN